MACRNTRRDRAAHDLKSTAIIAAALLFANLVAVIGLGSAARAGEIHGMIPYAPLSWEKRISRDSQARDSQAYEPRMAAPRAEPVAAIAPVDRGILAAAARYGDRSFAEHPVHAPQNRIAIIAIMAVALGAMSGVSVRMMRGLARDLDDMERRRREFFR